MNFVTVKSRASCSGSKAGAGLHQQGEGSTGQFNREPLFFENFNRQGMFLENVQLSRWRKDGWQGEKRSLPGRKRKRRPSWRGRWDWAAFSLRIFYQQHCKLLSRHPSNPPTMVHLSTETWFINMVECSLQRLLLSDDWGKRQEGDSWRSDCQDQVQYQHQ